MAMDQNHHPESSHREERTAIGGGGRGESAGGGEEMAELMYSKRGCCFWMPYFGSSDHHRSSSQSVKSDWWERIRTSDHQEEKWWKNVLLKVREWSEIVAGPRWKTFIRRFKKNSRGVGGCCGGGGGGGSVTLGRYQYDPLSYALNFEEQNDLYNEDFEYPDFSSRYASIPISAKSSMDLGKDGPSFT